MPFRKKMIAFLDRKHFTVQQKPVFFVVVVVIVAVVFVCLFVCFFMKLSFGRQEVLFRAL